MQPDYEQQLVIRISETVAAPVYNGGPQGNYTPRAVRQHPIICTCEHCVALANLSNLSREETNRRYGL